MFPFHLYKIIYCCVAFKMQEFTNVRVSFFFFTENFLLTLWIEMGVYFAKKNDPIVLLLEPASGLLFADSVFGPNAACPVVLKPSLASTK